MWINKYVKHLADKNMDVCSRTITGCLSGYINRVWNEKDKHLEAYKKTIYPDPITSDFLWAMDTTIKEKKYSRFETQSNTRDSNTITENKDSMILASPQIPSDEDMINDVVEKALQLPYNEAINFMGEIAGAWILTYPIEIFNQQSYVEMIFNASEGWPSEEED